MDACLEMYLDKTFLCLCCCLWKGMCGARRCSICTGEGADLPRAGRRLGQSPTPTVTPSWGQGGAEVSTETSQHSMCPQNLMTRVTARLVPEEQKPSGKGAVAGGLQQQPTECNKTAWGIFGKADIFLSLFSTE